MAEEFVNRVCTRKEILTQQRLATLEYPLSHLAFLVGPLVPLQPKPSKVSQHTLLRLPGTPSLISVLSGKIEQIVVLLRKNELGSRSKVLASIQWRETS